MELIEGGRWRVENREQIRIIDKKNIKEHIKLRIFRDQAKN